MIIENVINKYIYTDNMYITKVFFDLTPWQICN